MFDSSTLLPDMSGSNVGVASKVGTGKDGATIVLGGFKGGSDRPGVTSQIPTPGSSDSPSDDVTSDYDDGKRGDSYTREKNGVVIKHLSSSSADAHASGNAMFNALAGYTDAEWSQVKLGGGPMSLSSDGTASIFHGAPTVVMSSKTPDGAGSGLGDGASDSGADSDMASSTLGDGSPGDIGGEPGKFEPVEEKAICIDESGVERCYGEQWSYSSNECKICSCVSAGSVECREIACDPYPQCPSGHFVVEEKAGCCTTYRIVKNESDVTKCSESPKQCAPNEILIHYAVDDCCASYECHCDVSSCFKLGAAPPCPFGSVRVHIDSGSCCPMPKCVPDHEATAASSASVTPGIGSYLGFGSGTGLDGLLPGDKSGAGSMDGGVPTSGEGFGPSPLMVPQLAPEACICVDATGVERKFGDQWYNEACKLCSCTDDNSVVCQAEKCDDPLPEKEGMQVVEEKTSKCCSSYRYAPADCDTSTCQYQADVQCSACQRVVSYAIDECCATHECVCDESRCTSWGSPSCPPGAVRVVVDHDACCPVPKCVYMDGAEASSAANAAAHISGSTLVIGGVTSGDSHPGMTSPSFDDSEKQDLPKSSDYPQDGVPTTPLDGMSKGETLVATYVPGKTNLGSTALADMAAPTGFGFGAFGPQFGGYPYPMDASGSAKGAADSLPSTIVVPSVRGSGKPSAAFPSFADAGDAFAQGLADGLAPFGDGPMGGKIPSDFEVASEAAICTDKSGAERSYGEQWSDDSCNYCTCVGIEKVECKSQTCDPKPVAESGKKVVTEAGTCCDSYRVVDEKCETDKCQMQVPTCQPCEKLVSFKLDECCATYECRCNKHMCAEPHQDIDCPAGFSRVVLQPEACCPVGKCVSTSDGKTPDSSGQPSTLHIFGHQQPSSSHGLVAHATYQPQIGSEVSAAGAGSDVTAHLGPRQTCDEPLCMDEQGRSRCYGETWYKDGDACHVCACTNTNTVSCEPRKCESYPSAPFGHKVVEEKADDCCFSYKIVPDECDTSKCAEAAPICAACQDLVRYSVDKCCSTYECVCNPSKCFPLADVPCPNGMERVVTDESACCAIGKCLPASESYPRGTEDYFPGDGILMPGSFSPSVNSFDGVFSTSGDVNAFGDSTSTEIDSPPFEIISEAAICEDSNGKGRCYGDTWQNGCEVCTCANVDKIT